MISFSFSSLSKRPGATVAGVFSLALSSVVLLCGAGLTPTGSVQKSDINANGYNLTNAATVSATNVIVSGSLTTPTSFTLPFSKITSAPTTLSGYGITDPVVLTSGSYANPSWITSLAYSKLTGTPTIPSAQVNSDWIASSGAAQILNKPTLGSLAALSPSGTADSSHYLRGDDTWATAPSGYTLPVATSSVLGGVKQGSNVTIAGDGTLSVAAPVTSLPFSSITSTPTTLSSYGITDPIVLTSGSYANPSWITSLAYSKLTGAPTIPAAQVNSDWSASSGLAQILNKPTTLGGYGITDAYTKTTSDAKYALLAGPFPWADVTGLPTTLAGYGITDPIVLTSGSYANPSWITSLAWSKLTVASTDISSLLNGGAVGSTTAQASQQALGIPFNKVTAKSANFTVTGADAGTLFNVTTSTSAIVATLPSASSLPSGWTIYLRKADSAAGTLANDGTNWMLTTGGHMEQVSSDGTAYINRAYYGAFSATGDYSLTVGVNKNINFATSGTGAVEINGVAFGALATQNGTFSGTSSGTNTGDQTISITGDGTASGSTGALNLTVTKLNGASLAGLASGLLYNTTSTGVPSIATANQVAAGLTGTSGTLNLSSATVTLPSAATFSGMTEGFVLSSSAGALSNNWTVAPAGNATTATALTLSAGAYTGAGTANAGGFIGIVGGASSGATASSAGGKSGCTGGVCSGNNGVGGIAYIYGGDATGTNGSGGTAYVNGGAKAGSGNVGGVCIGSEVSSIATVNIGASSGTHACNTVNINAGTFTVASTTIGIKGTVAAGNATAGNVGEEVESSIPTGSAISMTTATATNITSISLTAGDWDVEAVASENIGSTATVTQSEAGISTTTATLPTDGSEVYSGLQGPLAAVVDSMTVLKKRINVSSTTTIYLVGKATFSAGTVTGFGKLIARRVR